MHEVLSTLSKHFIIIYFIYYVFIVIYYIILF